MRPTLPNPLRLRGTEIGGPRPLFCIPLVASTPDELLAQAQAVLQLQPDVVEWRADAFADSGPDSFCAAATALRGLLGSVPLLFTLRHPDEGGLNQALSSPDRLEAIVAVLGTGTPDLVDVELHNPPEFLAPVLQAAKARGVRVVLSAHNFTSTPASDALHHTVAAMVAAGADIAKLAVMPQTPADVLRLLAVTAELRERFPHLPLITMSMGTLGAFSRVAGFLYGSDMSFAVGVSTSAPGQIPIAEARATAMALLAMSTG